jgi:hypothetical protein
MSYRNAAWKNKSFVSIKVGPHIFDKNNRLYANTEENVGF